MPFRIKVPLGYDLLSSVHSWIYPDIQPVPEQTGDGYFGRVYRLRDEDVAIVIEQDRTGGSLRIRNSESDITRHELQQLIEWTLGLNVDMDDALAHMREDPVLSLLVPKVAGIRPYLSPTPYEALIKTIIQQQISYRAANMFTKRMVLGLTKPVVFEERPWYSFPDCVTIRRTGSKGLKNFGFGYKTEYIHGAASLIADGGLDIDSLIGVPYEKVLKKLEPIRGIGEWTVKVLSLAGLGDFSVFAYSDLVIQRILGMLYNDGKRMTAKEVKEHSETWGDSATKVLYLLMSAEVLGYLGPAENP
ncbi:MAG: DNA-3-methyladenine glycosylase family protein [Promethearchaeota archaeon]